MGETRGPGPSARLQLRPSQREVGKWCQVPLCWKWSVERTGWCGTSPGHLPPRSCGLAGSFLLAAKGAEQLPQLLFPIIDATWKGSRVLGLSLKRGFVVSGVACASPISWEEGTAGAMQRWVANGLHPGSTPELKQLVFPFKHQFSHL